MPPLQMSNKRRKCSVQGANVPKQPALPPRTRLDQQKVGSESARRLMSLHTIAAGPHDTEALLESALRELVLLMDCIGRCLHACCNGDTVAPDSGATSRVGVDHDWCWSAPHPRQSGVHDLEQQVMVKSPCMCCFPCKVSFSWST